MLLPSEASPPKLIEVTELLVLFLCSLSFFSLQLLPPSFSGELDGVRQRATLVAIFPAIHGVPEQRSAKQFESSYGEFPLLIFYLVPSFPCVEMRGREWGLSFKFISI